MTHDRNCRTAATAAWCALALLASACAGGSAQAPSEWPPADFRLQLEELQETDGGAVVSRSFVVTADGLTLYRASKAPRVDPVTKTAVPVFETMSAYRMLPVCSRLLARHLYARGVLGLEPQQGDRRVTGGKSLRLSYRAFAREVVVTASGQIHGSLVRVLHVVNAYVPRGLPFGPEGMSGDPEPSILTGIPVPATGLDGAFTFHQQLVGERPDDLELLVDAFALACACGRRSEAEILLGRWTATASVRATAAAPFADPPSLLPEMLQRMLPP